MLNVEPISMSSSNPLPIREPEIDIPGYTIHNPLGQGGMATVYLATEEALKRKVAIKVLRSPATMNFGARFVNEAQLIASINHANVVTIYRIGKTQSGIHYFVMEYISGGDLQRFKGTALPPAFAMNIIEQVAKALQALHKRKILHRDIKPANILFREDGTVVLSDFGIAKNLQDDLEMTQTGFTVGSPAYSSPEQTQNQQLDERSDIYSLGVVLVELLLGYNPFKGDSYAETAINHIQMERPILPEHLCQYQYLVDGMLSVDQDDRFDTMEDTLNAIQGLGSPQSLIDTQESTSMFSEFQPFHAEESESTLDDLAILRDDEGPFTSSIWRIGNFFKVAVFSLLLVSIYSWWHGEEDPAGLKQKLQEHLGIQSIANIEGKTSSIALSPPPNTQPIHDAPYSTQINSWLNDAERRLKEDKLTVPNDDSAFYYYQSVLGLDSKNEQANRGLNKIASRYKTLAQQSFDKGQHRKGFEYIDKGLTIVPDHSRLLALRSKYQAKK